MLLHRSAQTQETRDTTWLVVLTTSCVVWNTQIIHVAFWYFSQNRSSTFPCTDKSWAKLQHTATHCNTLHLRHCNSLQLFVTHHTRWLESICSRKVKYTSQLLWPLGVLLLFMLFTVLVYRVNLSYTREWASSLFPWATNSKVCSVEPNLKVEGGILRKLQGL